MSLSRKYYKSKIHQIEGNLNLYRATLISRFKFNFIQFVRRDTKQSDFLDLLNFWDVAFSVEIVTCYESILHEAYITCDNNTLHMNTCI